MLNGIETATVEHDFGTGISTLRVKKGTSVLLSITLANINRFCKFFSLLNMAINLQQNFYYIAHHTLNVLLHYLVNSKLLILLFCKHNKCKCSYFWTRKRGCFSYLKYWLTTITIFTPTIRKTIVSTLLQRQREQEHCSGLVVAHSDNFHKVRHGICRCVEAEPNPPHIRGP